MEPALDDAMVEIEENAWLEIPAGGAIEKCKGPDVKAEKGIMSEMDSDGEIVGIEDRDPEEGWIRIDSMESVLPSID